jgi:rhodanese-related sulfurtransferase
MTHQVFEISNAHEIVKLSKEEILDKTYILPCFKETKKEGKNILDLIALLESEETILVDVRELSEIPKVENIKHLTIPLSQLENRKEELTAFKKVVFICKSGVRSARAKASVEDVYTQIKFEVCDFGAERLMQELNESVLL